VTGKVREWDDPEIADFALEGRYEVDGISCAPGFQLFRDIVADHTPERMEEICTVPAATMRRLAKELGEAARIGETIMLEGKEYPFRPAAVNYYRGAIAHKDGGQDSMALKMLNTLLGNIDMPGGHLGVPLDIRGFFIEPGEHGMVKPNPHILHPPVSFKFPADSLQMMEWFPLGMDAGHIAVDAVLNPEKYRLEYVPEVLLTYHSNPVWNMPAQEKVRRAMATFKYVISIDVVINETTEWADLILPDHTYLESTLAVTCEPPVVKGLALRQPAIPPIHNTRDATEILIDIAERCGFLDVWNGFLNFLLGLTAREDLMLAPERKYSNDEIMDRVCRVNYGDDHDLAWFKEHGHMVTKRNAAETYLPYDGLRIPFYYEVIRSAGLELAHQFEATGYEWDTSNYVPLPFWKDGPIHGEDPDYPLYAITFKTAETNFAENMSIPIISRLTSGAAQTRGVLLNPVTAGRLGIADGDPIAIVSRVGRVEGAAALSEGVHPDTVAVSNALTRSLDGKKGTHFNTLLSAELEYTDNFSGALESVARVRVEKLVEAMAA
jgi:anaerobic selenocysteine-containing dehydrogenase